MEIEDYYLKILRWCSEVLDMVGNQSKINASTRDDLYQMKLELIDVKRRLSELEGEDCTD